jgi:hypothetical protein
MTKRPSAIGLSTFQRRVMSVPEQYDLFLGGGRGGSKSFCLALLALRHAEVYGEKSRVLYLRRSYKGIADFEEICREVFGLAYDTAATYNASEHIWRLPTGGYFELGQIEDAGDYTKFQGRSFGLVMVDEAGQYPEPALLDRLRSNMRARKGVPIRFVMAANPGDVGHHWLAERYVFRAQPWEPFHEPKSRRQWVYAPSCFTDNPYIDQDAYRRSLESACPGDPELLRAWVEGDWAVARGAFFAGVLSEERCAVAPWKRHGSASSARGWDFYLAHDFGTSAPSVTYVCAVSPGATVQGKWYPRDSVVLVDELATADPERANTGLGWTIPRLAEEIRALWSKWVPNRPPKGAADDACFAASGRSAGTIGDEFRQHGVYFSPAHRGQRIAGWEKMRLMLEQAGKPDLPGLYISRGCSYFWRTVPYLARDPKRPNDVDSRGPDHAADACRYALTWRRPWGWGDLYPDS